MYYLLEDNRIIDSEKTKYFDLYTRIGFLLEIDGETVIKNLGKIKKQSENVFYLIEVGDLVKYERYDDEFYIEEVIDLISTGIFVEVETPTEYVRDEKVLAIYKPNEKGDYIKVWEKKDGKM